LTELKLIQPGLIDLCIGINDIFVQKSTSIIESIQVIMPFVKVVCIILKLYHFCKCPDKSSIVETPINQVFLLLFLSLTV